MEAMLKSLEAAAFLGISVAWLERQRWLGTGPKYVKVGRAVRYRQRDLESYLEEREVFPNTSEGVR